MSAKNVIHDNEIYSDDKYGSTLNNDKNIVVLGKNMDIIKTNSSDDTPVYSTNDKTDVVYYSYLEMMKTVDSNCLELLEKCDFDKFRKFVSRYK